MLAAHFLSLALSVGSTSVISIDLKEVVTVDSAYPALGDIAVISQKVPGIDGAKRPNTSDALELAGVPVGGPLLPGRKYRYSKAEVEYHLRMAGIDLSGIEWVGPGRVTVNRNLGQLDVSTLEQNIRKEVAARFALPLESVEISLNDGVKVDVPGDEFGLDIEIEQAAPAKQMSALISVISAARLIRKERLRFSVSLWEMAITAVRDIRSNTEISPSLVSRETVDVLAARGKVVGSLSDLAGSRVVRPVRAGQPISLVDIEPVPAVLKSREVDVIYASGKIAIKMKGTALEDGVIGETIMVSIPTSETPVAIKVTGLKRGNIESGV